MAVGDYIDGLIGIFYGPVSRYKNGNFMKAVLDKWNINHRKHRANKKYLGWSSADDIRRSVDEVHVIFQKVCQLQNN